MKVLAVFSVFRRFPPKKFPAWRAGAGGSNAYLKALTQQVKSAQPQINAMQAQIKQLQAVTGDLRNQRQLSLKNAQNQINNLNMRISADEEAIKGLQARGK